MKTLKIVTLLILRGIVRVFSVIAFGIAVVGQLITLIFLGERKLAMIYMFTGSRILGMEKEFKEFITEYDVKRKNKDTRPCTRDTKSF